ncbi:glycoside hydrolase family 16 protein [bacterium]|nr:glycoside hydrolase family 16 protein [bacterium]
MKRLHRGNWTTTLLGLTALLFGSLFLTVAPISAAPPDNAEWELTFEDEFNGDSVDWDVWVSQAGPRGGAHIEGRWPENNVVKDGFLYQVTKRENPPRGAMEWSTAHIWTNFTQQYGYFECRMKYGHYLNNAFWLYRPPGQYPTPPFFEIDINEGHTPYEVTNNYHFYHIYEGDPPPGQHYSSGHRVDVSDMVQKPLDEEFHLYACEWNEDIIVWYLDGQPTRVLRNPNSFAPADVRLSTVITGAALERDGMKLNDMEGVSMVTDWVRVYKKVRDLRKPELPEPQVYQVPQVEKMDRQVEPSESKTSTLRETFELTLDGGLPEGFKVGSGAPGVAPAPAGGSSKALQLGPQDYTYYMFEKPISGRFEIELDYYGTDLRKDLLLATIGKFDESDPNARENSYYTSGVGAYISWDGRFITYYREATRTFVPFGQREIRKWTSGRFVFDVRNNVFDYYSGSDNQEFRSGGEFRHSQPAVWGIALRNRGQGKSAYIDNLTVRVYEDAYEANGETSKGPGPIGKMNPPQDVFAIINLEEGATRAAGMTANYTSVPDQLLGSEAVIVRRVSATEAPVPWTLAVSQLVTVYLLVQERGDPGLPAEWEKTDMTATWKAGEHSYKDIVYRRDFEAGEVDIPTHQGKMGEWSAFPHVVIVKSCP